jgi:hypothetical protein
MSETSPITAVHELAWTATPLPQCAEHDGAGHVCLPFPDDADLTGLLEAITAWYGQPLILDVNSSHPLLAPFPETTEPVVRMHAWPCNRRWIGCGITRCNNEDRVVLLFADRTTPAAQTLPEDLSWVERVVTIAGWEGRHRPPPHAVDWTTVEERLGTALPQDYKQIAEIFGSGAFDGYLRLYVPDALPLSFDLVRSAERLAEFAVDHSTFWEPYSIYPAPGGLLEWAGTEQEHQVYWLTEGPDPNRWPILTTDEVRDKWERFDGSTAEFVFRMLTDPLMPFLRAESQDVPWFTRRGPG